MNARALYVELSSFYRAIDSELHAQLTKGNRQVCWRFLRKLFKLFQTEKPLGIKEVEHLFCICAASDEEFLQVWTNGKPFEMFLDRSVDLSYIIALRCIALPMFSFLFSKEADCGLENR